MKLLTLFLLLFCTIVGVKSQEPGAIADKPLFRDPVFDGAADPVVVWNPKIKKWWMFYTNRRANAPTFIKLSQESK